jgi:hypothetical protein
VADNDRLLRLGNGDAGLALPDHCNVVVGADNGRNVLLAGNVQAVAVGLVGGGLVAGLEDGGNCL